MTDMFRKMMVFSLLSLALGGCTKEDTGDCGGPFRLRLSYTLNDPGQDLLAAQVRDIRVYVFDGTSGLLVETVRPGRQDIANGYVDIPLPNGLYTFVVWGGGGDDLFQGGYLDAEMSDPTTFSYTAMAAVGSATFDNFRMMLAAVPLSRSGGELTPVVEAFDDLFFAMAREVEIRGGSDRSVDVDFIKNTGTLKIKVTGLDHLPGYTYPEDGRPLDVFVTGRNGVYGYDNVPDPYAPLIRFESPHRSLTSTEMEVDIKVQRLDVVQSLADPVLLHVLRAGTQQNIFYPLNVVEAILAIEDGQGNRPYATQRDIDREDEFPIEISIMNDLSVRVTVNGFEIVDATPIT